MKALKRVARYSWLVVIGLGAVLAAILLPRWNPLDRVRAEIKALDEEERAKKLEAELDYNRAIVRIDRDHQLALDGIAEEKRAELEKLRSSPSSVRRRLMELARGGRRAPGSGDPGGG